MRDPDPGTPARKLSEEKALSVGKQHTDAIIIVSNLLVVCDEQIYEKPHDVEEALRMSSQLSGSTFDIVTGLAVYDSQSKKMLSTT
ncbi:MAG: Maf family protein [Candidatus Nanoarchaeia archaeon]